MQGERLAVTTLRRDRAPEGGRGLHRAWMSSDVLRDAPAGTGDIRAMCNALSTPGAQPIFVRRQGFARDLSLNFESLFPARTTRYYHAMRSLAPYLRPCACVRGRGRAAQKKVPRRAKS